MRKDSNLVQCIQSPQRKLQDAALEQLYFRNKSKIEAYIGRNNGTKEDAEEVLQDALVTIFQAIRKPGFRLTSKLDTFLFGVARNIWFKRLRKQRREIETVSIPDQVSSPEWILEEEPQSYAISDKMLQLIRKMSNRCREILTMIYVEEKEVSEIMEALEYQSLQVVRNKKSTCLKKLKEHFQGKQNRKGNV